MSPRRKIEPGTPDALALPEQKPRRWGVALVMSLASLAIVAALGVSTFVLVEREAWNRQAERDRNVIYTVQSFMTLYTSPDPFHANDYADKVLARTTGQLAQLYKERMNEVVIQVARAEPATGSIQGLGIERWNDDGTVDVVVAGKTSTKLPDGKVIEDGNRWVVTATKEGEQWKISSLLQVI